MTTLLVNPKMNPALASRVVASVTGRKRQSTVRRTSARVVQTVRLVVVLALAGLVGAIILSVRREHAELREAREQLTARWAAETATLTKQDREFLPRIETKLVELANQYPGDFVAQELKAEGALSALFARPSIYIRGPTEGYAGSNAVARTARESGKDTLLLCLVDPPDGTDQKAMLEKARLTLFGAVKFQAVTSNVLRLYDLEAGLPVLQASFGERIRTTKDQSQVARLDRELRSAPVALAKRALRSEILIAVFDEPKDKGVVTELDGEAPHVIQVSVISLDKMTPLIRVRRHVDPHWITANRRAQYAVELDGCQLAMHVRSLVNPTVE